MSHLSRFSFVVLVFFLLARCRYEQGLEDYEEAVARVDKIKEDQQHAVSNGWSNLFAIFSFLHNAWNKSPQEARSLNRNEHMRTAGESNAIICSIFIDIHLTNSGIVFNRFFFNFCF